MEEFDLTVIQRDNPQDTEGALEAMLRKWLESSEDPTWRAVMNALKAVKEVQLAKKLETQFCPGMYRNTTSMQLTHFFLYYV